MRKLPLLCLIGCAAILMACPVQAKKTRSYSTEVTNRVSIGDVNIDLLEYEKSGDDIIAFDDTERLVTPGQTVSRIARIRCKAEPVWIRMRAEYSSDGYLEHLDDSMLYGISDNWVKRDGYWYLKTPVETDNTVTFITGIHIPDAWTENASGKSFHVVLYADAVQEKNFTPDFDADDPWFGTVIEQCVHDSFDGNVASSDDAFSVEFKGGAEGLVKFGNDFFNNFGILMPGDTVSDKVYLKNSYKNKVDLYFETEKIADDELLKTLSITITGPDGKTIYDGTLDGTVHKTRIASLKKGEEETLTYSLAVPAELDNKYAQMKTLTKWIFSCDIRDSGKSSASSTNPSSLPSAVQNLLTNVKTGDTYAIGSLLCLIGCAVCIILAVFFHKKDQSPEESESHTKGRSGKICNGSAYAEEEKAQRKEDGDEHE